MVNTYVSGSIVRVANYTGTVANPTGGFRDNNGNLTDPTTIILVYTLSTGLRTSVTYPTAPIVKDAVGLYHADLDTTGATPPLVEWKYEWEGQGTIQAAAKNTFEVIPSL